LNHNRKEKARTSALNLGAKTMTNLDDLRSALSGDEVETNFGVQERRTEDVNDGRIFGLTAGERMILSIILFLAISVISIALLLITNTIKLP
jgi:hypothetical protein